MSCPLRLGLIGQGRENGGIGIRGRFLGDVIALVPSESGVVRWSDERAKPFEKRPWQPLAPGSTSRAPCPRPCSADPREPQAQPAGRLLGREPAAALGRP